MPKNIMLIIGMQSVLEIIQALIICLTQKKQCGINN